MKIKTIALISLLVCSPGLFAETLVGDLGAGRTIVYEKIKKKELDLNCSNKIIDDIVFDFKNKKNFSLKELMVDNKSLKIKKVLLSKETYLIKDKNKVAFLIDPSVKGRLLVTHGIFKGQKIEEQKWNLWNYKNKISFNSCFVKEVPKVIVKKPEEKKNSIKIDEKEKQNISIPLKENKEMVSNIEPNKKDLVKSNEVILNKDIKKIVDGNSSKELAGINLDELKNKEESTPKENITEGGSPLVNTNLIPLLEIPKGFSKESVIKEVPNVIRESSSQNKKEVVKKEDLILPKIEKKVGEAVAKKEEIEDKKVISKKVNETPTPIKEKMGSLANEKSKNQIKLIPKKKMTEKMIRKEKDAKILNSSIESMKEKSISNKAIKMPPKTRLCIMEETEKLVSEKYPNYEITDFSESSEFKEHMDQSMMKAINLCANKNE